MKDLKGTSTYSKLKEAYEKGMSLPQLAPNISKTIQDVPKPGTWADNFEDTEVHIERVIAYWSCSLKSAE